MCDIFSLSDLDKYFLFNVLRYYSRYLLILSINCLTSSSASYIFINIIGSFCVFLNDLFLDTVPCIIFLIADYVLSINNGV
nr:MAG TPA: hypothetical protein [Caudoviricetes sp.]